MRRSKLVFLLCLPVLACAGEPGASDPLGGDAGPTADSMVPDPGSGEFQLELIGTYPLATAADVAASPAHNLVAISEWVSGAVSLIDVSDPANPALYARVTDVGDNADVQFRGDRMYLNHEPRGGVSAPYGVRIFDISDPTAPIRTGTVNPSLGHEGLLACHNTWAQPDRQLLYCASTYSGHVLVLATGEGGVGTADEPVFLAAIPSIGQDCLVPHDMHARGDRLYVAWLCDGFGIYDIRDPSAPELIGQHNYQDSMNHNLWPIADGDYLLSTDEVIGGHLRVFDIRDLADIREVGSFQPNPGASIHNVEAVGNLAFISHYTDGVYVVDISDPSAPRNIAADDFVTGPDVIDGDPYSVFRGAWGVEAALPYVYVSDMEGGLRIYRLEQVAQHAQARASRLSASHQ